MSIKVHHVENTHWGYISLFHKNHEQKFSFNVQTNEIFNTDSVGLIRFKCMALTIATPFISVARAVYYLAKSIFIALKNFYYYLENQRLYDNMLFSDTISESYRVLKFGVFLTKTAIKGIFYPLENRRLYGKLERELNRHTDSPHHDGFYLAICFQPLTKLPIIESVEGLKEVDTKLFRYLNKIDEAAAAFCACDLLQLNKILHQRPS